MIFSFCFRLPCRLLKRDRTLRQIIFGADPRRVVAAMKEMPTDDPLFNKGIIRQDGCKLHPLYLFQVKDPARTVGYRQTCHDHSGRSQAFRPLSERGMPVGHELMASI